MPVFTLGLASFIAFLEGAYTLTNRPVFVSLSQFWLRIFAISFGMGVVTGIIMPFQFGTSWSRFSDVAGNIISPLLAYEGLTAFFLEATFLGVLLFRRKLVPSLTHFAAALLVAAGHYSHLYGYLPPIAGCRRRLDTRSSMAAFSRSSGGRSSSMPSSRSGWLIRSPPSM